MTKRAGNPATRHGAKRPSTSKATRAKASALNSARARAVVAARAAAAAAVAAAKAIAEAELEGADVSDLVEDGLDLNAGYNADDDAPSTADPTVGPTVGKGEDYLDFLSRMFDNMGDTQKDSERYNDMSRSVGMVLGSGPAFAALESMFACTNAQSTVLMNATQTQRQLDHVGLCCTSACVKQLLNLNTGQDSD